MSVTVSKSIQAPVERVWAIITDIDQAAHNINAIDEIKVLERPEQGLIGLKWEETRTMFGKAATETMWISDAVENQWYETTAHNCGSIYQSRLAVKPVNNGTELSMSFNATPTSLGAKLLSPFAFLFRGAIRKALKQDLADIQQRAES